MDNERFYAKINTLNSCQADTLKIAYNSLFSIEKHLPFWLVSTFLILSGSAALTYQVVWVRLLGLSIGSTSVSISIVLAAFFLGMGLGSFFAGHVLKSFSHALKSYLFVEAGLAISALVLLPLLLNLDHILSMLPVSEAGLLLKFSVVMLLLFLPTFCIGATFPLLMAVAIRHKNEIGPKLAYFYAFNTIGALLGVLLCGFVLIPRLGLDGTVYVAAGLNVLIVLIGLLLRRRFAHVNGTHVPSSDSASPSEPFNNKALAVLFATGFSAIATEVGWMKYLIIYTGNTIYGFSLILAIFLAGLAIGSWFARHRIISGGKEQKVLFTGLILLGFMLLFARSGLSLFPEIYAYINSWELDRFLYRWSKYLIIFLLLLPATFLFGALFPVALKLYSGDLVNLHKNVGKAYAVNIVAGIIGSLMAGFWLIPVFGTDTLLSLMAFTVLFASLLFITEVRTKKARYVWAAVIVITVPLSFYLPKIDYKSMTELVARRGHEYMSGNQQMKFHFLKEGHAGVISMVSFENDPCTLRLLNNGMRESKLDICDPDNLLLNELLLGLIPYFLHHDANHAFALGYGGGTTLKALSMTGLDSIDVVELEPAVVDAVKSAHNGKLPTDGNPAIHMDFNDARHTLLMSERRYDIIVSQPSHPWLAGGSNIMSKDFFEIVNSRLSPQGIYAQWVPLFSIDIATLQSIIKAYTDTFAHVVSFVNFTTKDFLLFGSQSPIVPDHESIRKKIGQPGVYTVMRRHGINSSDDLMRYFALSRKQLVHAAGSAEPTTDTNLLTEVFRSRGSENGNNFDTAGFIQRHMMQNATR